MSCSVGTLNPFTCNGGEETDVINWLGLNNKFATSVCCAPYNQGVNGGNVVGACPITAGACQPPLTSVAAGAVDGVVNPNTNASQTSAFIGRPTPPADGTVLAGAVPQLLTSTPFNA